MDSLKPDGSTTVEQLIAGADLDAAEVALMGKLNKQLTSLQLRNGLRTEYADGEHILRGTGMLGSTLPPTLEKLEVVVGWPRKAVDVVTARLNLLGFVVGGQAEADPDLAQIVEENNLLVESELAHDASLVHGISFVTVSEGDETAGEPKALIQVWHAREATAIWSPSKRKVIAGMTVAEGVDGIESPRVDLLLDDRTVSIWREGSQVATRRSPHTLGYVPMFMLAYNPTVAKRYGQSRITRPLMALTDAAVRTLLRMEGTAEFFSFPQRWVTGADPEDFDESSFKTYMNRLLVLTADEDGHQPSMGTFAASSPEPHIAQLRAIAMLVAGETSIPPNYLGIIQDNPASADAIRAAEADLVKVAEKAQTIYGQTWCDVARCARHIRDGHVPDNLGTLRAQWRDPSTPTKAANAQSAMTLVGAGILPPTSEVTWEWLGLDPVAISRLKADTARQETAQRRQELVDAVGQPQPDDPTLTEADAAPGMATDGLENQSVGDLIG